MSDKPQEMFCYQCEQTANGTGCTVRGVCGKDPDMASLMDTLIFSLKGIAAYAYHARVVGKKDDEIDAFMHEALFKTLTNVDFDTGDMLNLVLRSGSIAFKTMEMLDRGNTEMFGLPVPVKVMRGTVKGPGILVSGHDLLDLEDLLKQTEGKGINIYTHGEMLPAHGYPKLKAHKHLVGHWGSAWQNQRKEFPEFGGAILATTNCVQVPTDAYKGRLFTTGIAAVANAEHVDRKDFSLVIKKALELGDLPERNVGEFMTGFHHSNILALADKIIPLVKAGKIKRFFVIGGCDGVKPSRNYYTELAEKVPRDCIILTAGCGKFKLNHLDLGDIEGIPRLLDVGQCNNSYSAVMIAVGLAKAFNCDVNDLPLSIVLSWYEQKAVAVLLSLLALGAKRVRVGPTAPAFLTKNNLNALVQKFDLKLITNADDDMKAMLGGN